MLRSIDRFLNGITMYKAVLYGLLILAACAVLFGFTGMLSYGGWTLLFSLILVSTACWLTNEAFARMLRVPANSESWLITAIILFFLFSPILGTTDAVMLVLAGVLAMAGKYLLAWNGKHLFNPAALAAVILGVTGMGFPVWWIGTSSMLPVVLIVGLLIVRKIRRFPLFLACVGASFAAVIVLGLMHDMGIVEAVVQNFTSWPIIFFASVMVTEPLTMPPRRSQQLLYGAAIGAVSSWPIVLGPVYFTPELVLLLGNLYAYAVSMRRRLTLRLQEKRMIANDTYAFAFAVDPPPRFLPGQYLEWTLPHPHADDRGNRRYFTIASSPTESTMLLGVKIGPQRSTYKERLLAMEPGETLLAGQLGGDFTLPAQRSKKLAFIAGGIGVTPFRSHIKYLIDNNEQRDIVLLYAARTAGDLAYRDLLEEAERAIGLRVIYALTDDAAGMPGEAVVVRAIDESLLRTRVPDFAERTFYLSGPTGMVDAYKALLQRMGVHRARIVTDYFPGFA